jgi:micrococcal nuclease
LRGGILVDVVGVVDGDTIKVGLGGAKEGVRVIGIDTPELSPPQCYAQKAASKMQSLVQSKQVIIGADSTQADRDSYGRLLRHVSLPDGQSVRCARSDASSRPRNLASRAPRADVDR